MEKSTEWRLRDRGSLGKDRFLSVDYVGNGFVGKDLGFALCSFPDEPSKVQLTMHAVTWQDDRTHPDDAEYLAAERMTDALFRDAAKVLKHPLRLSRSPVRKHMVGKLAQKFRAFCARSNDIWTGGRFRHLHQTEEEEFYSFICAAHSLSSALTPEELDVELRNAGFDAELGKDLARQYEIGRRVLAIGTWQWDHRTADMWNPWNVREDRKRSKARRREHDEHER